MIYDILPTGKENAISATVLTDLIGCKDTRELRLMIASERDAGQWICSSTSGGYYKPKNRAEIAEYYRMMTSRSMGNFRASRWARNALKAMEGQQEIELIQERGLLWH